MIGTLPKDLKKRFGKLVSVSVPCDGVSATQFLCHAEGQARFLWTSPNDETVLAGFGSALSLEAWGPDRFEAIGQQAKILFNEAGTTSAKLFGGFAFRDSFTPENAWAKFAPAQFVLPHFALELTPKGGVLSIHAGLQGEAADEEALREALLARRDILQEEAASLGERTSEQAKLETCRDLTSPATWQDMVETAQGVMRQGELKKVVLARVKEACFTRPPASLLALEGLNRSYKDCYRFLFEPQPGHAFLGATPELLVQVKDKQARSMALAASAPRGTTKPEDDQMADELLNDPKEVFEHKVVSERLTERLATFGKVEKGKMGVLKLHNIQHLYTPVNAQLKTAQGVLLVVKALHPTPALGGEPRDLAGELIEQLERQPRGWYGAPIGYLDSSLGGAFAVAIRSAVVQQERAWLFSGAGIVPDSVPDKEWRETALKFRPMTRALGLEDG